ncbi:phage Gp37/Gp68 family protein [Lysinibacillus sphaericus]|uniref:Bacteriophage protein gp37 n=1 Tax=Lysinibacillus sphaericus TaxID=1421 RepID=A0A2S0JZV1_LYSSH|nr:phage Gp37/Gp68 family protein [Lysinibacillus sphaericus]AVK96680.1 hypothetical protein LS41612_10590 [Lysinibacillus sphaericus]MED4543031.1 phage Gp37/Gp68 family protein [Lysinibacillus sphaericus]TKI16425.1 phage Gp37/Gp68 family protein [Lysinibacillus sphaericus]SUV17506.1 Bacteriophage protein gp37 [Lysinibacillus sphaericus]GEC83934.1 hypothetical protein LSP03_36770 [Lysinibacillus sphaericus]
MSSNSNIEWTEATWNPVTGCSKVSQGCKNCYAERMAKRLVAMGNPRYINGFKVTLHDDLVTLPYKWAKPRKVFVNSMSDLFHEDVPLEFIQRVFDTMNDTPRHTYQILTKRAKRLSELASHLKWGPNIWMGVSIENESVLDRIDYLRTVPATVRFLSCEPLLGPLNNMDITDIHWVIVGGESGPHSRPMEEEWVWNIKLNCERNNVAFFFKQWGGVQKFRTGRLLKDKIYDEYPKTELFNPTTK